MRYYVLNQQNKYFEFKDWFDLIYWIKSSYLRNTNIDSISIKRHFGHNLNDSYTQFKSIASFSPYKETREKFLVEFVVFDQNWRVVRVEDIYDSVIDHKTYSYREKRKRAGYKRPRENYRFRYDPVPYISGGYRNSSSFWKSGCKLQDRRAYERDKDIIHNLRRPKYTDPWDYILSSWTRSCSKTWKRLKIKKQWMKH